MLRGYEPMGSDSIFCFIVCKTVNQIFPNQTICSRLVTDCQTNFLINRGDFIDIKNTHLYPGFYITSFYPENYVEKIEELMKTFRRF